jgi:hypothetical protein
VAALPEVYQEDVAQGIRADDFAGAEQIVLRLRREACLATTAGSTASEARRLDCTEITVRPGSAGSRPSPTPGSSPTPTAAGST